MWQLVFLSSSCNAINAAPSAAYAATTATATTSSSATETPTNERSTTRALSTQTQKSFPLSSYFFAVNSSQKQQRRRQQQDQRYIRQAKQCTRKRPRRWTVGQPLSTSATVSVVPLVILFIIHTAAGQGTNVTLTPTLFEPGSSPPTSFPTAPTFSPTWSPSPTVVPSLMPSFGPTLVPTTSIAPSGLPTMSMRPSYSPSLSMAPSFSSHPSLSPSDDPTMAPTISPSPAPTLRPTITASPTDSAQPTTSSEPTASRYPTSAPTRVPTSSPSVKPTISAIPSRPPTAMPTSTPTASPAPSLAPTISDQPSTSKEPSLFPSSSPSASPTALPTAAPTTPSPTRGPSSPPSSVPSEFPSGFPTNEPTNMPTLTTFTLSQDSITMTIDGLPGELTVEEQNEWESLTTAHVLNYYKVLEEEAPGLVPVNLTSVTTNFKRQAIVPDATNDNGNSNNDNDNNRKLDDGDNAASDVLLEIEYSQTIIFGVYDKEKDTPELEQILFVAPFEFDTITYMISLLTAWQLEQIPELDSFLFGAPSTPPTVAPSVVPTQPKPTPMPVTPEVPAPSSGGISRGALRGIAVAIVAAAVLVVAFLLWDRFHKDERHLQIDRENETMEFDNAGQPIDWRNPYATQILSPSNSSPRDNGAGAAAGGAAGVPTGVSGSDGAGAGAVRGGGAGMGVDHRRHAPPAQDMTSGGRSGGVGIVGQPPPPRTPPRHNLVSGTSPYRQQHQQQPHAQSDSGQTNQTGISSASQSGTNQLFLPPPPHRIPTEFRHTSRADTDTTDLSFSDGGGPRSDDGSDFFGPPPVLPTISDEHFNPEVAPLSPLHIPDEEAIEVDSAGLPSSPVVATGAVLGLGINHRAPSMSGFDMQVQELE